MTDTPAPYTGHASAEPDGPAQPEGPPQPAFPTVYSPRLVTWHSRVLLIAVVVLAVVAAILNAVGGQGFPGAAPIEQLYCFGLIVDLVAVSIVVAALGVVEFVRRRNADRRGQPLNTRFSVFAIFAIALAFLALIAWAIGGGLEQFDFLLQGVRGRYMYHTGGLFAAGIPWALAAIFGAWGFRPRGNLVTNVLAGVAIGIWLLLAVLMTIAALVYGAGLSD